MQPPPARTASVVLFVALALSGVAGIVNQVLWQRALKIYLGGSETLSSMVVVLVFLAGLGIGAELAGRQARRLRNPLAALAAVELALALGNTGLAWALGLDITASVYALQRLAVGAGIPLRVVYGAVAAVVLFLPTLAMGATLPFASEAIQRQLGADEGDDDNAGLPGLFFVNTVGAAFGAWAASGWLLPSLGQRRALLVAVAANAVAGLAIATLAGRQVRPAPPGTSARASGGPTPILVLGALLGFASLGYEMLLFRLLALAHDPVPTTFATGLAGFLGMWAVGVAWAGRARLSVPAFAGVAGALVALVPAWFTADLALETPLWVSLLAYTLPCVGFGALYGALVRQGARDWGADVGRYTAWNTVGSCAGIVWFTVVGYEAPAWHDLWAIAALLSAIAAWEAGMRPVAGLAAVAAPALMAYGLSLPYTENGVGRTYWGRDGVVRVQDDGDIYLDGLWHTRLSDGEDHVGHAYTWLMAFAGAMAHADPHPRRALVVGAGVGISSVCLAGIDGLQVDGYEINHTLRRVLDDYPSQTLFSLQSPRIDWRWMDARTGMALDPTRYDILLSAPLYLRQAGSSLLLSVEYLRLAKSRLAEGGVLVVYSNEGSEGQTRLIQRTLSEVFRYRVSWDDGTVTAAADHPIALTREALAARLTLPDHLYAEARTLDAERADDGGLWGLYDGPGAEVDPTDRVISDDDPLVEYVDRVDAWSAANP
jgi:predicted membrane-bound spermidine synthase